MEVPELNSKINSDLFAPNKVSKQSTKKDENWNKCGGSSIRSLWEIIAEKNVMS